MKINSTEIKGKYLALLKQTERDGIEQLIEWLIHTDFFIAPASTKFHGACEGGLLVHSMYVYTAYKKIQPQFCPESSASAEIMCLLHDVCKANVYAVDYKNAKNANGVWEKIPYYKYDDHEPYGHGEKSVDILRDFIELSKAEKYSVCTALLRE